MVWSWNRPHGSNFYFLFCTIWIHLIPWISREGNFGKILYLIAVITDFGYLYVWGKGMASVLKRSVTSGIYHSSDNLSCLFPFSNYLQIFLSSFYLSILFQKLFFLETAPRIFDNQPTPREIRMPGGRKAVEISSG